MRILVLQTTRMGDVLQTTPLIRAVRRKYPDAELSVMVRGMGKAILGRNPDVDHILIENEDEMFLDLRAQDSDRLLHAYETAEAHIADLKAKQFDLAFNCTHSLGSAMLLKLAEIPEVVGAHLSDDWQYVLRGSWIKYFYTSVFHREYNDLNLCDITGRFAEGIEPCRKLVLDVHDEDRAFVDALLTQHNVAPDDFVACFQLGASEDNKRWTETRFAELGRLLAAQRRARIFLVGVNEEAPLGEAFAREAPGLATPLFGKTSIPQLAALLARANVLVTNDTGTMHIAAAVGCPVALVSVGYVHFRETGPYGAGHCAVEWRRPRVGAPSRDLSTQDERSRIRPEHVQRAVELALAGADGTVPQVDVSPEFEDIDLFVTRFAPDGCLQWYPVLRRPLTEMEFLRIAYRAMWLEFLAAQPNKQAERASLERILSCYDAPEEGSVAAWQREQGKAFGEFAALAQQGLHTTERLLDALGKGGAIRKAQQYVAELMTLDEEMRVFSEVKPACRPLARIARYERDNLEGADPQHLARTTRQIYRDGFARARLMQKKLDHAAEVWAAVGDAT